MLLLPMALAQEVPEIDVQLVRPSADSEQTLWVDDAHVPVVNVGSMGVPTVDLAPLTWDDRLLWRAAVSMPSGPGGLSIEVGGQALYTALDQPGGVPVEAVVAGWYRVGPTRFVLRSGAVVSLVVTDPDGAPLPFEATLGDEVFRDGVVEVQAGRRSLTVSSKGCDPLTVDLDVPQGAPIEHRVALGAAVGVLRVSVVDPQGEPLDASLVVVDVTTSLADMGEGDLDVPAGDHMLVIETEEYFPARLEFTMDPGGLRHLEVRLQPVIARMTADRIQVDQTVDLLLLGARQSAGLAVASAPRFLATVTHRPPSAARPSQLSWASQCSRRLPLG